MPPNSFVVAVIGILDNCKKYLQTNDPSISHMQQIHNVHNVMYTAKWLLLSQSIIKGTQSHSRKYIGNHVRFWSLTFASWLHVWKLACFWRKAPVKHTVYRKRSPTMRSISGAYPRFKKGGQIMVSTRNEAQRELKCEEGSPSPPAERWLCPSPEFFWFLNSKLIPYGDWWSTSTRAFGSVTLTLDTGQVNTVVHLSLSTTCIPSLIKIA